MRAEDARVTLEFDSVDQAYDWLYGARSSAEHVVLDADAESDEPVGVVARVVGGVEQALIDLGQRRVKER